MRKLLLFIGVILTFSSCGYIIYHYQEVPTFIDYSIYDDHGFFITESNSVSFEYTPIGFVQMEILPGYENLIKGEDKRGNVIYKEELRYASINRALMLLYENCISKGADGVINLKYAFSDHTVFWDSGTKNKRKETKVTVSGMAIKRKQP